MRPDRRQVLARRRAVCGLEVRSQRSDAALRRAAAVGLSDSMPRGALLSLHARIADIDPQAWADPALVQVWGPRYNAYVVAAGDHAPFTIGRMPDSDRGRRRAADIAGRIRDVLGDREVEYAEVGRELGIDPNALRYAAPTGTVLIRWQGSGKPTVRLVDPPEIEVDEARRELVRRYLHHLGPATSESFAAWAGVKPGSARASFDALAGELVAVRSPLGDAWMLEPDLDRGEESDPAPARLLPSGDAYTLLWGADRSLLVEDEIRQRELWTSRVWPGAIMVRGEIVGTWRRTRGRVTLAPWEHLDPTARSDVAAEAEALPIPDVDAIDVEWAD